MRPEQFEQEVCILSFLFVFCESFHSCFCLQVTAVLQGGCVWVDVFQFCPNKILTTDCCKCICYRTVFILAHSHKFGNNVSLIFLIESPIIHDT